jgi:hypothetical protein
MSQQNCSVFRSALCSLTLLTQACIIVEKQPETQEKSSVTSPVREVRDVRPVAINDAERWTAGMVAAGHTINGVATVAAVRTAKHRDYERIVFEFTGGQLPNYKVEFKEGPVMACGSGLQVPMAGNAWLEIRFDPAAAHDEYGQPSLKAKPVLAASLLNVRSLEQTCDFEAVLTWVAGMTARTTFRVLELRGPTRLVVDLR